MDIEGYFRSISAECEALKNRVRLFIDDQHWLTDGEWKESVLRSLIRRSVPSNIAVGRGFVVGRNVTSSQIDLLLYDNTLPVLYRDGDLAFITPTACRAIIEVKSKVRPSTIGEIARKLGDNAQLVAEAAPGSVAFVGAFAFEAAEGDPDRYLRELHDAAGGRQARIVDHLCLGQSRFLKFWPFEPEGLRQRHNHMAWHAYRLEEMAAGYFVHNLLLSLNGETTQEAAHWFPERNKEAFLQSSLTFDAR